MNTALKVKTTIMVTIIPETTDKKSSRRLKNLLNCLVMRISEFLEEIDRC